jgi:hypothetical protein
MIAYLCYDVKVSADGDEHGGVNTGACTLAVTDGKEENVTMSINMWGQEGRHLCLARITLDSRKQ